MTPMYYRELATLLEIVVGTRGHGPYRVFGDSHSVTMFADHPDIFELHWYVMRQVYNLLEHLQNAHINFVPDKINLFLSAVIRRTLMDSTCERFVHKMCSLRDSGLRVAVLSPVITPRPVDTDLNYGKVSAYVNRVGGYDNWRLLTKDIGNKMRELCATEGVDFIDIHPGITDHTGEVPQELSLGDGWHLNYKAGLIIADLVRDFFARKSTERGGDL